MRTFRYNGPMSHYLTFSATDSCKLLSTRIAVLSICSVLRAMLVSARTGGYGLIEEKYAFGMFANSSYV